MLQQGDDPPVLLVGTEVSAKYKGAFCEAKIRKVVRSVKCKVVYKVGCGGGPNIVSDEQIEGDLRVGETVQVKLQEKKDPVSATITKIQDCSHYTVVFDDGDITTLRRSALCLKSGRHFNESETLDQLPLTHPEHFGNPVIGGRRGRSYRHQEESSDEEDEIDEQQPVKAEKEENIGKVVCVESTETKKKSQKENWFPGLVVAPTAQDTVRIRVKDEYLVRSFKDGRYYTVPKKEATEFTRDQAKKQDNQAVQAALEYLDRDTLPPHWDRDVLFGLSVSCSDCEVDLDSDSSDDEPREEKDHFVAQLYKYMDDRGTPLNKGPQISNKDIDLYRLFRAAQKLGGYNRVTSQNQWKAIAVRLGFIPTTNSITNLVKQAYKKFLQPFEDFNRKLGCTMVAHPRANRIKGRSLLRASSVASPKPSESSKDLKSASGSSAPANEEYDNTSESSAEITGRGKKTRKTSSTTGGVVKPQTKAREEPDDVDDNKPILPQGRMKPGPKPKEKETVAATPPPIVLKRPGPTPKPETVVPETPTTPSTAGRTPKGRISESSATPTPLTAKGRKKKDAVPDVIEKPPEKDVEEEKKKEKKDTIATVAPAVGSTSSADVTPSAVIDDFSVDIGDKLKVFYHEKKVTYEAKVLEISADNLYLVHYTGWNTRYDEWVPKTRIAENLTNKQKRSKGAPTTVKAVQVNPSFGYGKMGPGPSKRGRGASRSDSLPPRSTTPCSVTSNSSRTKSPATPAQRRTTRGQPNIPRRTSNNTDISSMPTDESDTDSDEPVKKPTRSTSLALPPGRSISDNIKRDSKDASSSNAEDEATKDFMDFIDIDQIRSDVKENLKSPSPGAEQSPTSSVHLDHKISLFHLSDSNTDSNELKESKCSGSSSDTQSFDEEDSQGYAKKAAKLKGRPKKDSSRAMGQQKDIDKSLSKILGTDSSENKESKIVPTPEDVQVVSVQVSGPKGHRAGTMAKKGTGDGKGISRGLIESSIEGKKKDTHSDSDVYEFKEPEPFEFEASTTTSRKPSITQAGIASSLGVDDSKKVKKRILDLESPSTSIGKKTPKRSPVKATQVHNVSELIDKLDATEDLRDLPSNAFDALRKSPNFNVNSNPSGSSTENLPEFTHSLSSSEGFPNPLSNATLAGTVPSSMSSAGPIGPLSITGMGSLGSSPGKSSSSISSAFVNTRDDDDQWQSLRIFKNAVEDQIDIDIEELTKPKSVKEDRKATDFEGTTETRSSIADKFLKTFNQDTGNSSNSSSPSTVTEVASVVNSTKSLFGKDFADRLEPKIMTKKEHLKLNLPEIVVKSSSMTGSPDKLDSMLELKPRNNDLSETIEKLKSAINDEDSSVSSDSERERLVIEDDDRSRSPEEALAKVLSKDSKAPTSDQFSAETKVFPSDSTITKIKEELTISSVTVKEQSLSFASKFQESFYGSLTQPSESETALNPEHSDMDLTCKESIDDEGCEVERKDNSPAKTGLSPSSIRPPINLIPNIMGSGHLAMIEKDSDNLSLLLCEETIPTSPWHRPLSDKFHEDRKGALESRLLEGVKLQGQTPGSSPRDSQSPDDSKSDSEDVKKTESEASAKKRRRGGIVSRRSPDIDGPSKRRKIISSAGRKSGNAGGSDSEDNSDPLSSTQQIMCRSPKPCQYNFLVQLDPSLSSHQKIAILEKKIQDLRKTYNIIKSDLASIDRRRKKLRRREREIKKNQQLKLVVANS